MKTKPMPALRCAALLLLLSAFNPQLSTWAQGTAFTYQGRLTDAGAPANGSYDLRLILFNASVGGSQQGPILTNLAVTASNGLFTSVMDFGAGIFTGSNFWLEIAVQTNGGGGFTTLSPRQPVTPSPYAITSANAGLANNASNLLGALPASQLSGSIPSSNFNGVYSNAVTLNNAANNYVGNGSAVTALNASQLTSGAVPDARLSTNVALRTGGNNFSGNQTVTGGSLGIGTASPLTALHVKSTSDAQVFIESADVGGRCWGLQSTGVTGSTRDASFQIIDRTTNMSRLLIDTNGDVGIGTVVPVSALHIKGPTVLQGGLTPTAATTSNILNLSVGAVSNGFLNGIGFYETAASPTMSFGYDGTVAGTANNALRIYDNNGAPVFSFLSGGNLGIGTTAPSTALHVKDTGDVQVSIESGDAGGHRWTLQSSAFTGTSTRDASFQIIDRTVGAPRMLIDTNGNVGIHTASPASTLDVNGTATVQDLVVSNQAVRPFGTGTNLDRIHPIAYGAVSSDGTMLSGTPNFSVTNSSAGIYLITITGESYSFITYNTIVTPIDLAPKIPVTFTGGAGKMQVQIFNLNGVSVNTDFNFVVYKPGTN